MTFHGHRISVRNLKKHVQAGTTASTLIFFFHKKQTMDIGEKKESLKMLKIKLEISL